MERIEIKPKVLGKMREGAVLQLVAQELEINNAGMNGKDMIAGWLQAAGLGSSRTHVRNACEGRTCIGFTAWMVIVKRSGTKLYDEWCDVVAKQVTVGQ